VEAAEIILNPGCKMQKTHKKLQVKNIMELLMKMKKVSYFTATLME
jgi:hypothetical protein